MSLKKHLLPNFTLGLFYLTVECRALHAIPFPLLVFEKTKQKQKKRNPHTRQCYAQHIHKISGKNSKLYFSQSSSKFSFIKQNTWFLVKKRSLPKIIHHYFSAQNHFNQTITIFLLKSDIPDIHIPQ